MTQKKLRNNEDENVLSTFAALADEKNVDLTFLYNKLMEDSQYTKLRKNQAYERLVRYIQGIVGLTHGTEKNRTTEAITYMVIASMRSEQKESDDDVLLWFGTGTRKYSKGLIKWIDKHVKRAVELVLVGKNIGEKFGM
jgi:hypothetical protein